MKLRQNVVFLVYIYYTYSMIINKYILHFVLLFFLSLKNLAHIFFSFCVLEVTKDDPFFFFLQQKPMIAIILY